MGNDGVWPSTHLTLLSRLLDEEAPEGWSQFWTIYSPLIYNFCLKRSLQHQDALDVMQNAVVSLQQSLPGFDPTKGRFRGWFGQLIRREIFKYRQKMIRGGQALGGDVQPVETECAKEDHEWNTAFNAHVIRVAIENIRGEFDSLEWIVMEQVVLKGRKPRSVADEINRDAAWISRAKYRLVQRLKKEVNLIGDGDLD